jgi:hypothetical protein
MRIQDEKIFGSGILDKHPGTATQNLTRRDWRKNKKRYKLFVSLYLNIAVSRSRISSGTGVL